METLAHYDCRGAAGDAGLRHGRAIAALLTSSFVAAYVEALRPALGFTDDGLRTQAAAWVAGLPTHIREEIDGMAIGGGAPVARVGEFLYADLAKRARAGGREDEAALIGPMCSAVVSDLGNCSAWVARNCDWLPPTLLRGTASVSHALPGRIPVLAVGIRGDIDIDTGMNAEGLWLHLHTLHATDKPVDERPEISWLFWAREALETCATLDEVEAFALGTRRDQGVIAVVVDGGRREAAIFECSRGDVVRRDADPAAVTCVTNHSLGRMRPTRPTPNPSGTISRLHAMRESVEEQPPREGPGDLMDLLAREGVEMRTPRHLRTIYSAVCDVGRGAVWFASGGADGSVAASGGRWERVVAEW